MASPSLKRLVAPPRLPPRRRVLVVDDVPEILELFQAEGRRHPLAGVAVETEYDADRAIDRMTRSGFDVVVSDLRLRGKSGLSVLEAARERAPTAQRILITGYLSSTMSAGELTRAAPHEILPKPLTMALIRRLLLGEGARAWPHVASVSRHHPE